MDNFFWHKKFKIIKFQEINNFHYAIKEKKRNDKKEKTGPKKEKEKKKKKKDCIRKT